MEDSLLIQNNLKRVHISTPLPVVMGDVSLLIAAAYIVSIAFVYFFPQYCGESINR